MPPLATKRSAAKFYARCIEVVMSRVGSSQIKIPAGVTVTQAGQKVEVKGKNGTLSYDMPQLIKLENDSQILKVSPLTKTKQARMLWGTSQRMLANLVKGVDEGFSVALEINGTGYRAAIQGKDLVLQLGYSHEIRYPIPEGITIKSEKPTSLVILGADKQQVGQVAAKIRSFRPPEPYKGKGVIRVGEYVLRKEGKKK